MRLIYYIMICILICSCSEKKEMKYDHNKATHKEQVEEMRHEINIIKDAFKK